MDLVQKVCIGQLEYNYPECLNGVLLQVVEAIGGVNNAVCASFLSQLEMYDPDVGIVSKVNTQQHKCILVPILGFLSSTLILKIATSK